MMLIRRIAIFLILPVAGFAATNILFLVQGGFGGGDLRFDRAIGLMQLPGLLCLIRFPLERLARMGDYYLIVLAPFIVNTVLWLGAGILYHLVRSSGARVT